jgi:hypothetical protein
MYLLTEQPLGLKQLDCMAITQALHHDNVEVEVIKLHPWHPTA